MTEREPSPGPGGAASGPAAGDAEALAQRLRAGDRKALAAAITLVESRRDGDRAHSEALLQRVLAHTGGAVRVGITGAPGVGKSTLIDALGERLCAAGRAVAVLAVDPSSAVTGGSILGDKTRMQRLAALPNAFVRPSPGGAAQGGVAARTRETMLLCEAAGFDVVLIETIGTGQSEVAVAGMVDCFVLLLSPAAGDELQGIKRGVMELADVVVVHKADGELAAAAERVARDCALALQVLRGADAVPVVTASAAGGAGIDALWQAIERLVAQRRDGGELARRRREQAVAWLEATVRERVLERFFADPAVQRLLPALREQVAAGALLPEAAARQLADGVRAH